MTESHREVGFVIEIIVLGCGVSGIRKTNHKQQKFGAYILGGI